MYLARPAIGAFLMLPVLGPFWLLNCQTLFILRDVLIVLVFLRLLRCPSLRIEGRFLLLLLLLFLDLIGAMVLIWTFVRNLSTLAVRTLPRAKPALLTVVARVRGVAVILFLGVLGVLRLSAFLLLVSQQFLSEGSPLGVFA